MRSPRSQVHSRSFVAAVVCATVASVGSAQILNVDADSLTSYRVTSVSTIQGVRPLHLQRAVNVEGTGRAGNAIGAAIQGNPGEDAWRGTTSVNGVNLVTGAYSPTEIDISLPTEGPAIVVGRTANTVQQTSSPAAMDSNGYQGANQFQIAQPEIMLYTGGANSDDTIYLILGADRFVEFRRAALNSPRFSGRNGATGYFEFIAGVSTNPDIYVLTDTRGTKFSFFGFNTYAGVAKGSWWMTEDIEGRKAYVGDATSAATAVSSYDSCGGMAVAFDPSGRRFSFAYSTLDSVRRLTQVKVETKTGGTWGSPSGLAEVAKVDYSYYTNESHGDVGDLKQVTITKHLSDPSITQTLKKVFRYWEGTYNSSSNPGYPHALKYIYDFEGVRRFDWEWGSDHVLDDDILDTSRTDADLLAWAADYFEYDSNHRVREIVVNGSCGCGGGSNGTTGFTYAGTGYTNGSGYDEEPAYRTVVARPDGSYLTQFFDEAGQALTQVISDSDPAGLSPAVWITAVTRDARGCVDAIYSPENIASYDHTYGTFATPSTTDGLIHIFTRPSSGDKKGFITERRHSIGTSGTSYLDELLDYDTSTLAITVTDVTVIRPMVSSRKVYPAATTTDSGGQETSYTYTKWGSGGDLSPENVTVTPPTVDGSNNGSGDSLTSEFHVRKDGLVDFEKRPTVLDDGSAVSFQITFKDYARGQLTREVVDADTLSGDVTVTVPSGFDSDTGSTQVGKRTDTSYTTTGLRDEVTPAGSNQKVEKQYITKLADERLVILDYAAVGGGYFFGPVSMRVVNQAGKTEMSGVIGMVSDTNNTAQSAHIDEGDADPITAVDTGSAFGSLKQMTTSIYDATGSELLEERRYFLLPGSGLGSEGTNYDSTRYAYDTSGRRIRTKDATGTIRRTTYDLFGRGIDQHIGTNDYGSTGGEVSGPANMVKTEHLVYDGGAAGLNGRVTSRTEYVEDSTTGQRITNYLYDGLGRRIVTLPPLAPYTLMKFDNLNRVIAVGQYSSSSGLDAADDPTGLATNRLALSETLYDEAGRVWKTIRHKIDDADGSDDDTLETRTWYDELGRVMKVDGSELKKLKYDHLGRVTDEFILAKDDDSAYEDARDVGGDIVLEQRQTRYNSTLDTVIFSATISRLNTDYGGGETEGALDTNDDADDRILTSGDILGRMQVTGYWYDRTKREVSHTEFGTNGGSTLDFAGGLSVPPSPSDAEHVTWTLYDIDGTVDTVTDPREIVTKYLYDAMGRCTKEIKNYDVAVNSGAPYGTKDNVTVAYIYVNGLRTTLTADLPSGQTDQVTTYTYGTVKGASAGDSKIATGHLLQKVAYPDSSSGSDVVTFAYNAQGQQMWKKDQEAAVIETDLDTRGRTTQRRVTTLSSFDGAVRRIGTTYDGLGRTQLVTQYDNATVGSGSVVDEVKYTYDDWGNIEKFEQDRDSAVGAYGSVNDYEISYLWEKAMSGRNTIRKYRDTYPDGMTVAYNYLSSGGLHDDEVSRLTALSDYNRVILAGYSYTGVGQVVSTQYPEPQVMWDQFTGSGTGATYPDLDQFGRVIHSRWTRNAGTPTDFYSVDLSYDRNSNIITAEDNVHAGFDILYTMDDIDRLTEAKEGTVTWSGTPSVPSLSSPTRDQQWTLSQTGNWDLNKVDLNGDLDFADAGEENDTRVHNTVNEISTRLSGTKTLVYDGAGNLTDDDVDYKYEWDAFYRLRKVKKTSNSALVAEYRYNGLGYRIAEHVDTDLDNDVDGSDLWYFDAFDERWRQIARFRSSDTSPKEEFVAHSAGLDGRGGSSYIDLVALRQKDADTAWDTASDTVLEERVYYCQNWHADVSALVSASGVLLEWAKYSAYGVPIGLPAGDSNSDGDCDSSDDTAIKGWVGSYYDIRGDIDLDGDVDADDVGLVQIGTTTGRGSISSGSMANHRGLISATYSACQQYQLRNRTLSSQLGKWLSRDPVIYTDSYSLYTFTVSNPLARSDPMGLCAMPLSGGGGVSGGSGSTSTGGVTLSGTGRMDPGCRKGKDGGIYYGNPPSIIPDEVFQPVEARGMTSWDCMCAFQDRSNGYTSLLPDGEEPGAIAGCWNGRPVYCMRQLPGRPSDPHVKASNAINNCLRKHEIDHRDNAIEKNRCEGAGAGYQMMRIDGVEDQAAMEYSAIKTENDCLTKAAKNDPAHANEYDDRRAENGKYVESVSKKSGTTAPTDVVASCH